MKLKEPYEAVFVGLRLENLSTGESTIVDAKIDTGAIVTVVPMHLLDGMGLEILGERYLHLANSLLSPQMVWFVCMKDINFHK